MESVLSKFIPDFNLENLERDKEISKSLIMTLIEEKISISSRQYRPVLRIKRMQPLVLEHVTMLTL